MQKYINGGIIKEITLTVKKTEDFNLAIEEISEYVDLNLYDMKVHDNMIFFELNDEYIKENLVDFLKESNHYTVPSLYEFNKKITYIEEHIKEPLDKIIDECDDIFLERFRTEDTFSINSSSYYLDLLCYVFYLEGPFTNNNFTYLLQYIHKLQRNVLKNPLRNVLCYGLKE